MPRCRRTSPPRARPCRARRRPTGAGRPPAARRADVHPHQRQVGRRGVVVDRVAVAAGVGGRRPAAAGRPAAAARRRSRPGRRAPGRRAWSRPTLNTPIAHGSPKPLRSRNGDSPPSCASCSRGLRRRDRRAAAAAVDEHEAREVLGPGPSAEVPGRVGDRDRRAQRVAAQHDGAAAPARRADHVAQVADRHSHAPAARVRRVGHRREARRDRGVGERLEVVAEGVCAGRLAGRRTGPSTEWSSSRFSRRSTDHTFQPGRRPTIARATGRKYAAPPDVPGTSTSTFSALRGPCSITCTRSKRAGPAPSRRRP